VVAQGAPAELKARVGGERLEVTVGGASELAAAAAALSAFASDQPFVDTAESRVVAPVNPGVPLADVVRALDAAGVATTDLHRREATLDDVFLALTEPAETTMEVAA
jgi:ABC-2 type transport system ATP-binding protein